MTHDSSCVWSLEDLSSMVPFFISNGDFVSLKLPSTLLRFECEPQALEQYRFTQWGQSNLLHLTYGSNFGHQFHHHYGHDQCPRRHSSVRMVHGYSYNRRGCRPCPAEMTKDFQCQMIRCCKDWMHKDYIKWDLFSCGTVGSSLSGYGSGR